MNFKSLTLAILTFKIKTLENLTLEISTQIFL